MKQNKKIIVEINFNTWGGTEKRLTKEWIDYRISLFMNYTLKSLKGQTNQDFLALALYDPLSARFLSESMQKYEPLPSNVKFVTNNEFLKHVTKSIQGYKYIYHTYLASDDMFRKSHFQLLNDCVVQYEGQTAVLIPQYGYIYDSVQDRLGKFYFWCPSFCTFLYTVEEYLEGKRHKLEGGWRGVLKLPSQIIKEPSWINHAHLENTWFSLDIAYSHWGAKEGQDAWKDHKGKPGLFGPEIKDREEIRKILSEFI